MLAPRVVNVGSACGAVGALLVADDARASGAPGAEGILYFVPLIPTILWFVIVGFYLVFRSFERRRTAIAHLIFCLVCAIPAAIWLYHFTEIFGGSSYLRPFVLAGIVCVVIGFVAPLLQYVLRNSSIWWRRSLVIGAVSMAIAVPLGARVLDEIRFSQFKRELPRQNMLRDMGSNAKAGDFARFASDRNTKELVPFVNGFMRSRLFLGPEPLGTADAAAVQAYIDPEPLGTADAAAVQAYIDGLSYEHRELRVKVVASRHRTTASLVADKDAAALHDALLELLERNKGALFCDDPRLLRTRMNAWFAAEPQVRSIPVAPRIAALCK